LRKLKGVS